MSSDSLLMLAIKKRNAGEIRRLVADGVQLNCTYDVPVDNEGFPVVQLFPLVFAANHGDLELCQLLVSLGASLKGRPTRKPKFLPSPLVNALVNECSLTAVNTLIKLGCDVNELSARARKEAVLTPLFLAVSKDNFDVVKTLLEAGADVNIPNGFYRTPIHLSIDRRSNTSCTLNRLLDCLQHEVPNAPRPDLNAKDIVGRTPLMTAVMEPTMEAFVRLMKEGVDLESEDSSHKTALYYAVESSNSEEKVLTLLQAGCAISKPHWLSSPFLWAALRGKERFCEILLEYGASPLEKFCSGCTVLHAGAGCGSQKLVDLALNAGVSVNALDNDGNTAIMKAVQNGTDSKSVLVVKYLVQQHGARINNRSFTKYETALTLSFRGYALKCAMYLLTEGSVLTRQEKGLFYTKLCQGQTDRMLVIEECTLEFLLLTETVPLSKCLTVYESCPRYEPESRFYQKWKEIACSPHSLKHCCRLAIREALTKHAAGIGILLVIETLLLPEALRSYLCYREETETAFDMIEKSKKLENDDDDDEDDSGNVDGNAIMIIVDDYFDDDDDEDRDSGDDDNKSDNKDDQDIPDDGANNAAVNDDNLCSDCKDSNFMPNDDDKDDPTIFC